MRRGMSLLCSTAILPISFVPPNRSELQVRHKAMKAGACRFD